MNADKCAYGAAVLSVENVCHSALLIALGFVNHTAHLRIFAFTRGLIPRRIITPINTNGRQ